MSAHFAGRRRQSGTCCAVLCCAVLSCRFILLDCISFHFILLVSALIKSAYETAVWCAVWCGGGGGAQDPGTLLLNAAQTGNAEKVLEALKAKPSTDSKGAGAGAAAAADSKGKPPLAKVGLVWLGRICSIVPSHSIALCTCVAHCRVQVTRLLWA